MQCAHRKYLGRVISVLFFKASSWFIFVQILQRSCGRFSHWKRMLVWVQISHGNADIPRRSAEAFQTGNNVKGQVIEQVFLVVSWSSRLEMVNGKKTEEELSPAFHSLPTETTEPPSPFSSASVCVPFFCFSWERQFCLGRKLPFLHHGGCRISWTRDTGTLISPPPISFFSIDWSWKGGVDVGVNSQPADLCCGILRGKEGLPTLRYSAAPR